MKKSTLPLIIFCLVALPFFVIAKMEMKPNIPNSDLTHLMDIDSSTDIDKQEKFELTPKIKKGESWNMVLDVAALINASTESNSKSLESFYPYSSQIKTNYKVECIFANENEIHLKFTLIGVSEYERVSKKDAVNIYYFNDSDYPISLYNEDVAEVRKIIGKSFSYKIPLDCSKKIEILGNEFDDKKLNFPVVTFQSKEASYFSINYQGNDFLLGGPIAIDLFLDRWRRIIPEKEVRVGDVWDVVSENKSENEKQVRLKSVTKSKLFLEAKNGEERTDIILGKRNLVPVLMNIGNTFGFYTYKADENNFSLKGDLNNSDFNGQATLIIDYPIDSTKIMIEVKEGKFSLDYDFKTPVLATFNFQGIKSKLFLKPGMDLDVNWTESDNRLLASGFGANDFNFVSEYSKLYFRFDYMDAPFSEGEILKSTEKFRSDIESIVSKYSALSRDCEQYLKTDMNCQIATRYLTGIEEIDKTIQFNLRNRKFDRNLVEKNKMILSQFVDSVQLVGNVSAISNTYHEFILNNLEQEQRQFLANRGRRLDKNNFRESLLFAGIQYVGYPYYYSAFKILENEILKNNISGIRKELEDYSNLPCNPVFSDLLKKLAKEMDLIKVGNPFPYPEIVDFDGIKQKLPKGELCIVDLHSSYFVNLKPQHDEELEELSGIVKDYKRIKKINYVVIRPDFAKGNMVESLSNDTIIFKYIYLPPNDMSILEKCLLKDNGQRMFLLDKNLKIIDNNLKRIQKYSGHDFPKVLDDYFEFQNKPTSQAGNSRLLLIIIASLIFSGLFSWFVIRVRTQQIRKRESVRRKVTELELTAIRSQMNPHFIFNALGSIQNLINQNKVKNANLYLASFARLMRMVLANSNKKLVSLAHELELIETYLQLEQLRVDFKYQISVAENVDPEVEELPGMLIQPFLENAVIHGITPKGKGTIDVSFSKVENTLICEIIDDGVGIDNNKAENGNGLAIKLSEKRLDLLNSQLQDKLKLVVENRMESENTSGTRIILYIPV